MAPNPRRVRIFLAEKKVELDIKQINILEGENLSEEYLSINRWGYVPTLELEDGTCISEAPCIFQYIEICIQNPIYLGPIPLKLLKLGSEAFF